MEKKIIMLNQPDYTSCGPTSLQAIYGYYGDDVHIDQLVKDVEQFDDGGGTLAVVLGSHALNRNYEVDLYSYNINVFDPSWFNSSPTKMIENLKKRLHQKLSTKKEKIVLSEYITFIERGGNLKFEDLSLSLLKDLVNNQAPILTGLSSTWLYRSEREDPITSEDDPICGDPSGHFVIVYGIENDEFALVADPYRQNIISQTNYYKVTLNRLMNAILLGISSYDGNLLVIKEKK